MELNMRLDAVLLILTIAKVRAKEPDLPPCPTSMQFFPQTLPMHCRMTPGGNYPSLPEQNPTMPPYPPGFYQSPSPDKLPNPIPFPVPPVMPGFPPGFPGPPPGMPGPPLGMPGPGPMPMPFPMPVPMAAPGPAHKLPVIVMPFYSPDPSYKKRREYRQRPSYGSDTNRFLEVHTGGSPSYDSDTNRFLEVHTGGSPSYDSDTNRIVDIYTRRPPSYDSDSKKKVQIYTRRPSYHDTSSDTSSEGRGWWRGRRRHSGGDRGFRRSGRRKNRKHKSKRRHNNHDLLTPILQYVTKDGYVIFEKKISKGEAKDWLSMKKEGEKKDETELADIENVYKNNEFGETGKINEEVEILNEPKDKSKEQVEVPTSKAPKRHFPHKLRSHTKTVAKGNVPS